MNWRVCRSEWFHCSIYFRWFSGFLLIPALLFSGCGEGGEIRHRAMAENDLKDPMLKANQHMVRNEENLIDAYVKRYNWPMQKTGTGLRYYIYTSGTGKKIGSKDLVTVEYLVSLMNGQECYNSHNRGPLVFRLGKGGTINGLEEAILNLRVGDRAKIIVPSHLAFGLLGDQDKIPQRATLVYDVCVTDCN